MRKELRYIIYSILVGFVVLVIVLTFSKYTDRSKITGDTVHFKKIISKEIDNSGSSYLRITGYNSNNELVTEWIDTSISKTKENHIVKMADGISQEKAIEIANAIISKADTVKLIYVPEKTSEISLVQSGVYWYLEGEGKKIFINFKNGDITTPSI